VDGSIDLHRGGRRSTRRRARASATQSGSLPRNAGARAATGTSHFSTTTWSHAGARRGASESHRAGDALGVLAPRRSSFLDASPVVRYRAAGFARKLDGSPAARAAPSDLEGTPRGATPSSPRAADEGVPRLRARGLRARPPPGATGRPLRVRRRPRRISTTRRPPARADIESEGHRRALRVKHPDALPRSPGVSRHRRLARGSPRTPSSTAATLGCASASPQRRPRRGRGARYEATVRALRPALDARTGPRRHCTRTARRATGSPSATSRADSRRALSSRRGADLSAASSGC
jgi:hypothetical protein